MYIYTDIYTYVFCFIVYVTTLVYSCCILNICTCMSVQVQYTFTVVC